MHNGAAPCQLPAHTPTSGAGFGRNDAFAESAACPPFSLGPGAYAGPS